MAQASTPRRGNRPRRARQPAENAPVATVCVDVTVPHLNRTFDYLIPTELDEQAQPGCRLRVRFAGTLLNAYLLERSQTSEFTGRLAFIERVVSPERVLTPATLRLAREVADRNAGTLADVVRLAIPPRHATTESDAGTPSSDAPLPAPALEGWSRYDSGEAFLRALSEGRPVRAVWSALPGEQWTQRLIDAALATAQAGRRSILLVPDARELRRLETALETRLGGTDLHVRLAADDGPALRYRQWLQALRGRVRIVIGTRAAAYAPLDDVGLLAIWDDGDDSYVELHAPYCHSREVILVRTIQADCAVLVGGFSRTSEAQLLVETGWARSLVAPRAVLREAAPSIEAIEDTHQERDEFANAARLPQRAWEAARQALAANAPVLVQAPRRGYIPALGCDRCRHRALCPHCSGPLRWSHVDDDEPTCRWCAKQVKAWSCSECGGRRLRITVAGAERTAEEIGRAFPQVPILTSSGDRILSQVEPRASVVIATVGAEPTVAGGYGAALLVDPWLLLGRADLRAGEETLGRWLTACALVRPRAEGGRVVIVADSSLPTVQALVRWDPVGFAQRDLQERAELGFPPVRKFASVTAETAVLEEFVEGMAVDGLEVLGPVPTDEEGVERALLRVSRSNAIPLATALRERLSNHTLRRLSGAVKIRVDPRELW